MRSPFLALKRKLGLNSLNKETVVNRAIFCISPGRSGSNYLAELLGTAREVVSFHEPEPSMTAEYIEMANSKPYPATKVYRQTKLEAINKILSSLGSNKVYCETNHMFIKTFFDVVIENIKTTDVIILRRDIRQVLRSFVELKYFAEGNTEWPKWMTSPNAVTSALPAISSDEQLDQYDLCIAYLLDIEARAQRFKTEYPWINVHEVELPELNLRDKVLCLFNDLGITPSWHTYRLLGKKVNERRQKKTHFNNPADLEYCSKRITQYIDKARFQGICVPDTILMKN
jgi:hypothetical protein